MRHVRQGRMRPCFRAAHAPAGTAHTYMRALALALGLGLGAARNAPLSQAILKLASPPRR